MKIPAELTDPAKRYDFLLLFDVTDGNPNGDPDAGNLPRVDPETLQGLVTDVCLKRKIRNYVDLTSAPDTANFDLSGSGDGNGNGIFVRDSGIALNTKIKAAAESVGAEENSKKENKNSRQEMCRRYFDIRMFGGVLSTGKFNSGQVRGPMQLTFARSIHPILPSEIAITRVAITKEGEQKETEIGRKASVPYGLYKGRGFFSPMLASDTGVTTADLELFWQAVLGMFENDRSAARGYMELKGVFVFRHEHKLGDAPSGPLFDRLKVELKAGVTVPRSFDQYEVVLNEAELPEGVSVIRLIG